MRRRAYGWVRNKYSQLEYLSYSFSSSEGVEGESTDNNTMTPLPRPLTGNFVTDLTPIVGADTRKVHTIFIDMGGSAYDCELNKLGQCGTNHAVEEVHTFKRCSIVGGGGGGGGGGGRGEGEGMNRI